jgi:uncharacterized C2H2 Zn-finger protein
MSKLKDVKGETIIECDRCGESGHVHRHAFSFVFIVCPNCQFKWKTHSEECIHCSKPNGFLYPGYCSECYGQK